jgi:hypothetical protein
MVAETIACECSDQEEADEGVCRVMDEIVAGLVQPLTPEEASPKAKTRARSPRIIFRGTIEEINRFFYKRGWGDGLPLIPPTEEAVAEMLTGTDLPPGHLVGKLLPRLGKATVEKIAINAVMAGALPVHMPVLFACVEAILDPMSKYTSFGVSTGSWSPFWIINGPIRNDIHVNGSSGALSPGNVANAGIGRAMGLIIKNIGGVRKGVEDMGTLGNPGKYSMVLGENEENSPWQPLHVDQGYAPEENTVSVTFPNCYMQLWPYGSDAEGIVNGLCDNVMPCISWAYFLLNPAHAKMLAKHGWTKEKLRTCVAARARVTPAGLIPIDAENIRIVVAGGPGAFMGIAGGMALSVTRRGVMKRIQLPRNWDKLVAKYRNMTPTYEKY